MVSCGIEGKLLLLLKKPFLKSPVLNGLKSRVEKNRLRSSTRLGIRASFILDLLKLFQIKSQPGVASKSIFFIKNS